MKKFIIFSSQRSGSTFFLRYLGSHPDIDCGEEIFIRENRDATYEKDRFYHFCSGNRSRRLRYFLVELAARVLNPLYNRRMATTDDPADDPMIEAIQKMRPRILVQPAWAFLHGYFNSREAGAESAGFKLMYNQCYPLGLSPLDFLEKGYRIIHWIRKNPLKVLISGIRKNKTGVAHSTDEVSQIRFRIDTGNLIRRLRLINNRVSYNRNILGGSGALEMFYEDFAGNEEKEIIPVLDFLGLERKVRLSTELRKITSGNLPDLLLNYMEVEKTLKNTEFERFLY